MTRRRCIVIALAWCAAIIALAAPARGAPVLTAGQGGEGWIAIESVWTGADAWSLYHVPRAGEPGTALRVRSLASGPEAMAARASRLMLVYPPTAPDEQELRSVRGLRVQPLYEGRSYRYSPPDREQVLAPLPGWGGVAGLLLLDDGAVALLQQREGDAPPRAALLKFDFSTWSEIPLPDRLDRRNPLGLAPHNDGFSVVEHRPAGALLWTTDTDGAWSSSPLVADPDETIVPGANNALVGVKRSAGGTVALRMLRPDRAVPLARIEGVPVDFGAFAVGENVLLSWMEPPEDTRLRLEVISSSSGEIVYAGGAKMQSLLSTNDLQYLALLMLAVLLMVLIFVLRPSPDAAAEIKLPTGVAPAAPGRRLMAAVIDVVPIAYASTLIWGATLLEAVGLDIKVAGAGVMPLLTTIAGVLAMQTLTEWLFSWTPGKLLTGCRTVSVKTVSRPSFRQALVRNLVKYACPPLGAMIIADPTRRHPGDFFAGTIVIAPAGPPEAAPPEDR